MCDLNYQLSLKLKLMANPHFFSFLLSAYDVVCSRDPNIPPKRSAAVYFGRFLWTFDSYVRDVIFKKVLPDTVS